MAASTSTPACTARPWLSPSTPWCVPPVRQGDLQRGLDVVQREVGGEVELHHHPVRVAGHGRQGVVVDAVEAVADADLDTWERQQGADRLTNVLGERGVLARMHPDDEAGPRFSERRGTLQDRDEGPGGAGLVAHDVHAGDGPAGQALLGAIEHIEIPLEVVMARQRHEEAQAHAARRFDVIERRMERGEHSSKAAGTSWRASMPASARRLRGTVMPSSAAASSTRVRPGRAPAKWV
jgi:hypothetical protein